MIGPEFSATEDEVRNTLCAMCGGRPSECLFRHEVYLHRATIDDILSSNTPIAAAIAIRIPCCGPCYDSINNESMRRWGIGGGHDWRNMYECHNAFHETGEGAVPKGPVPPDGGWRAYGCPDPRCTSLTYSVSDESPEACQAGSDTFARIVADLQETDTP